MKREVRVEAALGMVLAHDLTQIIPGEYKGRLFKKGHVITREDLEALHAIGKEHLYVLEPEPDELHEDEAARQMAAALIHESIIVEEAHEGKVTLFAKKAGVLRVTPAALPEINRNGELLLVTKPSYMAVHEGESVAVARAIPLLINMSKLQQFVNAVTAYAPVLEVLSYQAIRVAVVTTGSEVLSGRIRDQFGPLLKEKLSAFPVDWLGQTIVGDTTDEIVHAILDWTSRGANMVLVTGGMSVDPDDRTPGAIRCVATEVVAYGFPVLPGSMLMLAYRNDVVIMGLPGGVLYDPRTSFDLVLPRLLAGVHMTASDVAALGNGGMLS